MTFKHTIVAFAVWGDVHRQRFVRWALPSILRALPEDRNKLRPRLMIFTTSTDADRLEEEMIHPNIVELMNNRLVWPDSRTPPKAEIIRFVPGDHDGSSMVACQREALKIAWHTKSALAWSFPDCWTMPGSFEAVATHIQQHARACMYQAFSVNEQPATVDLLSYTSGGHIEEGVKPHLAWAMTKHIHPTTLARVWDDDGMITGDTIHPGMLYRLPTTGLPIFVGNAMHTGPVWVQPRRPALDFQTSMDGDFIECAGLSIEEIDVLTRGFFMMELAPSSKVDALDATGVLQRSPGVMKGPVLKNWIRDHTTPINRLLFGTPVVYARDPAAARYASHEAALLEQLSRNAREMARL